MNSSIPQRTRLRAFFFNLVFFLLIFVFWGCAGTVKTVRKPGAVPVKYTKAFIVSAEDSQFIKFRMGIITPYAYIPLPDKPAQKHEVIGDTDLVIKQELEKYGIAAQIGKKGDIPGDIDLIILYQDTWRWDFKKVLDRLEIVYISPETNEEIARSVYTIYQNKEFHNFPSPKKEVPKMIKGFLDHKIPSM